MLNAKITTENCYTMFYPYLFNLRTYVSVRYIGRKEHWMTYMMMNKSTKLSQITIFTHSYTFYLLTSRHTTTRTFISSKFRLFLSVVPIRIYAAYHKYRLNFSNYSNNRLSEFFFPTTSIFQKLLVRMAFSWICNNMLSWLILPAYIQLYHDAGLVWHSIKSAYTFRCLL